MSSLPVQAPDQRRFSRLYVVVGAVLFAAALAASLGARPTTRVTIDGEARRVPQGMTVADLAKAGYLKGQPGRMVSVSGRVLARSSGVPARAWRNGRPVTGDRVVYDGDVITSADGRNVPEDVVVKRVLVPFSRRITGAGPLMTLSAPGSVGVRQSRVGEYSGEVVTSTVITQPSPMIVKRYGTDSHDKIVALTFDDGPWPGQTEKILKVLKDHKVKGTFFMLGYMAKRHPSLAHRVVAEGHVAGNHTMGHKRLTKLKARDVDKQISNGERALLSSTGQQSEWFRPPGGHISPAVWSRVRKAGLKVALWTVDPQDWRGHPSWRVARSVVSNVRPGAIVLLHDGGGDRTATINALPMIIRQLKARGYRFVTLDEISQR